MKHRIFIVVAVVMLAGMGYGQTMTNDIALRLARLEKAISNDTENLRLLEKYLKSPAEHEPKSIVFTANAEGWYVFEGSNILATMSSNAYASAVFCPTNWCERIPTKEITNAVNDLAASGDICRVKGHWWPNAWCGVRKCKLCGEIDNKTEGEWR
jgi:hypothetical protein